MNVAVRTSRETDENFYAQNNENIFFYIFNHLLKLTSEH